MKVAMIKLDQFPNYKTCNWIKSLVFISSDFFNKYTVADRLFLECSNNMDDRLSMLNEASGVDFTYNIINSSLDQIKQLIKEV